MAGSFSERLLNWFDEYGRHDLPWQQQKTPYRVWVSEIMLQQTQVKTVIPYYQKFMQRFPTVQALAAATQDEVLAHWAGLGYYARGRNLHKAAQMMVAQFNGEFPQTFDEIVALPGIGRSTAGAILSIALGQRYPILDGNVKRVLARVDGVETWPGARETELAMWQRADELTPSQRFDDYTQAIMDMGATLCTRARPKCGECPMSGQCVAFSQDKVSQLPVSKPKKEKPVKETWMLLLHQESDEVWLQQRAHEGIWGGLYSLPEFESWSSLQNWLDSYLSQEHSLLQWETFRHTFSHYHLDIHPVYIRLHQEGNMVTESPMAYAGQWVNWMQQAPKVGVPAPVKTLLQRLEEY